MLRVTRSHACILVAIGLASGVGCQLIDPPWDLTSERDGGGSVDAGGDVTPALGCDASTDSDPANCGFCGHDCGGTACNAGICQSTSIFSASVSDMAMEGKVLYYLSPQDPAPDAGGGVYAFDTQTTSTTPLTAQVAPDRIAVHDPYVFWSALDGSIHRALEDGGAPTTLVTGQSVDCLAANGSDVFWADRGAGIIYRFAAADPPGSATIFRTITANSGCVVANDKYVVYTQDTIVSRFDIAANQTDTFQPSIGQFDDNDIALTGDDIYFTSSEDLGNQTRHYVFHAVGPPTTTPTPITSFIETFGFNVFAGDARGTAWGLNGSSAAVDGCSEPTCASGTHHYAEVDFPVLLALDPQAGSPWMYVYSSGQDHVYRIAR